MQLSWNELIVLLAFNGKPLPISSLAPEAARLNGSAKYDQAVAIQDIIELARQGYINVDTKVAPRQYELSMKGHNAVLEAHPLLEALRGALAGARWRL